MREDEPEPRVGAASNAVKRRADHARRTLHGRAARKREPRRWGHAGVQKQANSDGGIVSGRLTRITTSGD